MGKHPDLDTLDDLFETGTDFQLSSDVYEQRTGASLPKGKSYLKYGSALARKAAEKGYMIADVQEIPIILKTVFFEKK